jgi:hypothetical protein
MVIMKVFFKKGLSLQSAHVKARDFHTKENVHQLLSHSTNRRKTKNSAPLHVDVNLVQAIKFILKEIRFWGKRKGRKKNLLSIIFS